MLAISAVVKAFAQDDGFADLHAEVTSRTDLQFEFSAIELPQSPTWLLGLADFLSAIAPLVGFLFKAAIAIIVLLVLFFIGRELILIRWPASKQKSARAHATSDHYQPTPERARALLEEADRLAAAGRFAEAARHLLHRSIQDIEEHQKTPLSLSLTSREIGRLDILSVPARTAFTMIAEAVERGLFGERPVSEADFRLCRSAYADFALPESWA